MSASNPVSSKRGWLLVACACGVGAGALLLWQSPQAAANPPGSAAPPAPAAVPVAPAPARGGALPLSPAAPATAPQPAVAGQQPAAPGTAPGAQPAVAPVVPTTSRIEFMTIPPVDASVRWGKTRLGVIAPKRPLVIVRPRDSGPLDVVITAEGFLPVHTRAHTFSDTKVMVKLTPPDQIVTLLGYRVPIDAGVPIAGMGGTGGAGGYGGEGGGPPYPAPQPVPASAFDPNGMPRVP